MNNLFSRWNRKELRSFGLITGLLVALLFGLLLPWFHSLTFPNLPRIAVSVDFGRWPWLVVYSDSPRWPWLIALVLWIWAILIPATLAPLYSIWMAIGAMLGWINSRIILSILFYALILPFGLIRRMFGKDPMCRRFSRQSPTYRVPAKYRSTQHFEKPF